MLRLIARLSWARGAGFLELKPIPPTLAARWITTWAPSSAARVASRSRRSCSAERTTLTSAPSSPSRATVGLPRKPAPPVTVTLFEVQNAASGGAVTICGRLAGRGRETQRPHRQAQHARVVAAVATRPQGRAGERDPVRPGIDLELDRVRGGRCRHATAVDQDPRVRTYGPGSLRRQQL